MDVYYTETNKRRGNFQWSEETRWFFAKVADDFDARPTVRVAMQRTGKLKIPPVITVRGRRTRFVVIAFGDGIAVRLDDEAKERALQIAGTRELGRGDPFNRRKMISMPWSTREHWQEYIKAAIDNGLS